MAMSWKSGAIVYALIFAGLGSVIGYLLGAQDFKFPDRGTTGLLKGVILGALAGLLVMGLSHFYHAIRLRPIGGAIVCLILGVMIGALVGLYNANQREWENSRVNPAPDKLALEIDTPILWGGIIGIGVGLLFGAVDQVLMIRQKPVAKPQPER
jgi:hypothetical protein